MATLYSPECCPCLLLLLTLAAHGLLLPMDSSVRSTQLTMDRERLPPEGDYPGGSGGSVTSRVAGLFRG